MRRAAAVVLAGALGIAALHTLLASSHREAPLISTDRFADNTDVYAFRSTEPGREDFVTIIANYVPLTEPGGNSFYSFDDNVRYEIHIDQGFDAVEDITFRFRFSRNINVFTLGIGGAGSTATIDSPLGVNPGPGGPSFQGTERFTLDLVRGSAADPTSIDPILNASNGSAQFGVAPPNRGVNSTPDYDNLARLNIYDIDIPGCADQGRVVAGLFDDPFFFDLGDVFDLVNLNPLGPPDAGKDDLAGFNVSSLALEVPIDCLTGSHSYIGVWASASRQQSRIVNADGSVSRSGAWIQVSRLGMPLVNEVIIGVPSKDRYNASHPKDVDPFRHYITNPTLPELIEALFGEPAPTNFPRLDLERFFLSGIPDLNVPFPSSTVPADILRLDTQIPPTPLEQQNRLGALDGDRAGFPNGRRVGDDVVDIALRVLMGSLCHDALGPVTHCEPNDALSGQLPFTDGVSGDNNEFLDAFPYLTTPIPGNGGPGSGPQQPSLPVNITAILTGGNQVPPTGSNASGTCTGTVDANGILNFTCGHSAQNVIRGGIHQGPPGQNGPELFRDATGPLPIVFTGVLTQQHVEALLDGNLYVNVSTTQFPQGEIRGQIAANQ